MDMANLFVSALGLLIVAVIAVTLWAVAWQLWGIARSSRKSGRAQRRAERRDGRIRKMMLADGFTEDEIDDALNRLQQADVETTGSKRRA